MPRQLSAFVLLAVMALLSGCYHARVEATGQDGGGYRHRTIHSLAWGLIQESVVPDNCKSGTLHSVRVTTNFGYTLITAVTLGFWAPMDVEWSCGKDCPPPDGPQ
ncbi:MAG: hypothetical protein JST22_18000 [Bacteroidetes bacterium]|nr:hypothetical protein [Bacteroidota bacterium]